MSDILHDTRPRHWFWIENAILDVHAPAMGVHGLALYTLLARFANGQGQSFPALRTLATQLGVSRPTVLKYLDHLESLRLILKEKRRSPSGDSDSNLYTLLPVPQTQGGGKTGELGGKGRLPGVVKDVDHVVKDVDHGGKGRLPRVVKDVYPKETKIKETHLRKLNSKETNTNARAKKHAQLRTDYTPGFLRWWGAYPADRRQDKPLCFGVWRAQGLEARTEELIEKLQRLVLTSWRECERKYIKTALPYLNSGRYEDDLVPLDSSSAQYGSGLSPAEYRTVMASKKIIEELYHGAAGQCALLSSPERDESHV